MIRFITGMCGNAIPNNITAPNTGIALSFQCEQHRPGVGEFCRSAKTKWILPVLLIAALALCCSGSGSRESSVKDVTKNETIILKKKPRQESIIGISIAGRGSIVGKAEVQLILNGAVYKKEEISGGISFQWAGDWYSDQAEVRYNAGTASTGTLTLKYEFRDL